MKYKTLLATTLAAILGLSVGYHVGSYEHSQDTINVEHSQLEAEVHRTVEQLINSLESDLHYPHPEDVSIVLEADDVICGTDTPIKAEITNTSRQGKVMDGVMFYTLSKYKNSHHGMCDYNEPFVAVKLDLHPNETTFRCFAVPHETVEDMQYAGDSTYNDYLYIPSVTDITFRGE